MNFFPIDPFETVLLREKNIIGTWEERKMP